jgi:prepilin-type N-terminal cleavage/methylation domain-containing protein
MRNWVAHRKAFTLIELLVVIAVITILASLTMPAITKALRQAAAVQCRSNLGQIGKGNMLYANENDYFLPCYGDSYPWDGYEERFISPPWLVFKYLTDENIYVCPADPTPGNCVWWSLNHFTLTLSSYMWNEHTMTIDDGTTGGAARQVMKIRDPHSLALVTDGWECPNGWTWRTCLPPRLYPPEASGNSRIDWEHDGSVNVLYGDQHVARVGYEDLRDVRSDPR